VTQAGVGTNRYSYAFNDPVNLRDPGGNFINFGLAILGTVVSVAIDSITEYSETGSLPSPADIAKSAAIGAIAGITGGAVGGFVASSKAVTTARTYSKFHSRFLGGVTGGSVAGATAETAKQTIDKENFSALDIAESAALGGLTGGVVGGANFGNNAAAITGVTNRGLRSAIAEAIDTIFGSRVNKGYKDIEEKMNDSKKDETENEYAGS